MIQKLTLFQFSGNETMNLVGPLDQVILSQQTPQKE